MGSVMESKFALLDTIVVLHDIPIHDICKNTLGTIVVIHEDPEFAYEVEFTDDSGQTIAQVVLSSEDIALYAE
jgi:hypothetical protein